MRAVVKSRPEPGVEFSDVKKPRMGSDDVLVGVKAAAICGSDLGIYDYPPAYSNMRLRNSLPDSGDGSPRISARFHVSRGLFIEPLKVFSERLVALFSPRSHYPGLQLLPD